MLLHPLYPHSFKVGYTHGAETFYNDFHLGEDYILPVGHSIYAPESGVVDLIMVGEQGGLTLHLKSDNYQYRFLHLLEINNLSIGDEVKRGDVIATTGGEKGHENSGNSTAPHLHFDIYDLSQGEFDLGNREGFIDPSIVLTDKIPESATKLEVKKEIAQNFYNIFLLMPSENHLSFEAGKVLKASNTKSEKDREIKTLNRLYNTRKRDYIKHHFNPYSYIWRYQDLRAAFGVNKLEDLRPQVEKYFRDIEMHWLQYGIKEGRTDDYATKAKKQ